MYQHCAELAKITTTIFLSLLAFAILQWISVFWHFWKSFCQSNHTSHHVYNWTGPDHGWVAPRLLKRSYWPLTRSSNIFKNNELRGEKSPLRIQGFSKKQHAIHFAIFCLDYGWRIHLDDRYCIYIYIVRCVIACLSTFQFRRCLTTNLISKSVVVPFSDFFSTANRLSEAIKVLQYYPAYDFMCCLSKSKVFPNDALRKDKVYMAQIIFPSRLFSWNSFAQLKSILLQSILQRCKSCTRTTSSKRGASTKREQKQPLNELIGCKEFVFGFWRKDILYRMRQSIFLHVCHTFAFSVNQLAEPCAKLGVMSFFRVSQIGIYDAVFLPRQYFNPRFGTQALFSAMPVGRPFLLYLLFL